MATTKTELKQSFLQDILESEETQAAVQEYKDLLTGQINAATTQYQTAEQTAAERASYDISGAYANYLKQQRAVASQGQLESGHKEELEGALQTQYQSAYSQAKATQAKTIEGAQEQYVKNLTAYEEAANKMRDQIYADAEKKATMQANLYRAAEDYAALGESEYDVYTFNEETGREELTTWGKELLSKGLLEDANAFEQYLETKGLTNELEYYYSNPEAIRKELFGITDSAYVASLENKLSAANNEGKTMIDALEKPTLNVNANDFSKWDFGKSGHNKIVSKAEELDKYAKEQLGLTDSEIFNIFGTRTEVALANLARSIDPEKSSPKEIEQQFNDFVAKLDAYAKQKYIKG